MTISSTLAKRSSTPAAAPATHVEVVVIFTVPISFLGDKTRGMTNRQIAAMVDKELRASIKTGFAETPSVEVAPFCRWRVITRPADLPEPL